MAISFPSNPTVGQQYTAANITWEWNGTSWESLPPSAGIGLTNLSVTQNAVGTAALSYNNSSGVFSYTPPDLSSYLTSYTETDTLADVTGRGSSTNSDLTFGGNLSVTGVSTLSSGLQVPGGTGVSNRIELGNGQELTLQYNTSTTKGIISAAANPIDIQATTIKLLPNVGENGVIVNQNSSVDLYYDNSKKFETTGTGIQVTGSVQVGSGQSFGSNTGSPAVYYGDTSDVISGKWTLGADGINHYTFTGPGLIGAENDPTIYVQRGMIYQFVNNMGAHPFRIQSTSNGSAGSQYNDGLDQNDVSNGAITWEVQMDAPDTLYYQCTAHPNMGGEIKVGAAGGGGGASSIDGLTDVTITSPSSGEVLKYNGSVWVNDTDATGGGGGSLSSRSTVSGTTAVVGAASTTNLSITGFKSYGLLKIGTSAASWVRLYVDDASRTSDANRSYLEDPLPGSGLIAEVRSVSSGSNDFIMTPGIIGWNNDSTPGSTIYLSVTNNETGASSVTVDLTVVKLEN